MRALWNLRVHDLVRTTVPCLLISVFQGNYDVSYSNGGYSCLFHWKDTSHFHCCEKYHNSPENKNKKKKYSEYRIYSVIRQVFPSLEWLQIIKSALRNFAIIRVLPFLNNLKYLDLSYTTDLDFWDCFGRKISPTYDRRNKINRNPYKECTAKSVSFLYVIWASFFGDI